MFDLIFYKDIKLYSNLKNDAVRLGNELLKGTTKYISKNDNICMDLTGWGVGSESVQYRSEARRSGKEGEEGERR